MNSSERRDKIINILENSNNSPTSASKLANFCGVSRQIIVGDIALIRAGGMDIQATPRGYILTKNLRNSNIFENYVACIHGNEQLEDELYTILDFGGEIVDVTVTHPVYGEINAYLNLSSRHDANEFIKNVKKTDAKLLFTLTENGIHLHKIRCKDEKTFKKIKSELEKKKILFTNS